MAKRRVERHQSDKGYVLVDVLVALTIAAVALVSVIGGVAHLEGVVARQSAQISKNIGAENVASALEGYPIVVK